MKKRLLVVGGLLVALAAGYAANIIAKKHQIIAVDYLYTRYDESGGVVEQVNQTRFENGLQEWTATQTLPNGKFKETHGKFNTAGLKAKALESVRHEILLGRDCAVLEGPRATTWVDVKSGQTLKKLGYWDDAKLQVIVEQVATAIRE